jgi:acid phosphatase
MLPNSASQLFPAGVPVRQQELWQRLQTSTGKGTDLTFGSLGLCRHRIEGLRDTVDAQKPIDLERAETLPQAIERDKMFEPASRHSRRKIHNFAAWVKQTLIAAVASVVLAMPSVTHAVECPTTPNLPSSDGSQPANLGVLKLQLLDYKCFGAYDRDVANVLKEAKAYIQYRANGINKLALVLDIDETSLSNWPNLVADDFGFFRKGTCTLVPGEPCGFDQWIADHTAEPILPTLDLFNEAKAKGVAVFFISTRREDQRAATVNNLKAAGYDGWADLFLKQPDDKSSAQEFKTARRKQIGNEGFTIIANVGDQYSDLVGGHAERVFKVPNPFYFIP